LRVITAGKPTYEAYLERKKRQGGSVLDREAWERKVFGVPSKTQEKAAPKQRKQPGGVLWNPAPLFPEEETRHLPRWVKQDKSDPEVLFEQAEEAHGQMLHWLDEGHGVDQVLGAKVIRRDLDSGEELDLDEAGPVVIIGPMKEKEAARKKVKARYGGDWRAGSIDLVRATIAVDRYEDLYTVAQALRKSGMDLASDPRDRFSKPTDVGYRDIVFNVRMPNGHIMEMQLNLKEILKAKEEAHPYYTKMKDMQPGWGTVDKEYEEEIAEANRRQMEIYGRAWKAVQPSEGVETYPGVLPDELEETEEEEETVKPEQVEDYVSLFMTPDEVKKVAQDETRMRAGREDHYFEFDGLPVKWVLPKFPQFHNTKEPQNVDDMGAFIERRRTISKEEFDEMVRECRKVFARSETLKTGVSARGKR
jgi:hypothetical protein